MSIIDQLQQQLSSVQQEINQALAAIYFWLDASLANKYSVEEKNEEAREKDSQAAVLNLQTAQSNELAIAQSQQAEKIATAEKTYAESIATHQKKLQESQIALRATQAQSLQQAEDTYTYATQTAHEQFQQREKEIKQNFEEASNNILATYQQSQAVIETTLQNIYETYPSSTLPFSDPIWANLKLLNSPIVSPITRIGTLAQTGNWENWIIPAAPAIIGGENLIFNVSDAAKAIAASAMAAGLLRLLANIPAGKARCIFVDPVGRGQNVASFMHLHDFDEKLVTSRAWTEPQHIEQRLLEMTEHMENVIQKYLRNDYPTIEAYNADAGEVAEPYRFLVIFDFPVAFSETSANRLVSIMQNGPRCGVYTLIVRNTTQKLPRDFSGIADLERSATVIAWDGKQFVWQDNDLKSYKLELDTPPSPEIFKRLVTQIGEASKNISLVEVPFERIAPPSTAQWYANSQDGLRIALGPSGARKIQYLELGKGTAHHALVVGRTGSGKSTLLHTLITNAALSYSPDEVQLYLIDFKEGVEFKTYAVHTIPHIPIIAIESEREFGISVLRGLADEFKRRSDLFKTENEQNLSDYRKKTGHKLPRIILLVDEFQVFFSEDDQIASQSVSLLDQLVRQGRSAGIHILLATQSLAGVSLPRSTMDQIGIRIALQCSEDDSRLILASDNAAARLLNRPGEAIYNSANGRVEGNNPFQVAFLKDELRDNYLGQIGILAKKQSYLPIPRQIVFEGNATSSIQNIPQTPIVKHQLTLWLGEPIAIRQPVSAILGRQSAANLMIIGQDEIAILGLMNAILISLSQQIQNNTQCFVLDFGSLDESHPNPFTKIKLPCKIKIGRRRQLPEIINEIVAELKIRLDNDDNKQAPIIFIVHGLHRARDLRSNDTMTGGLSMNFDFTSTQEPPPPNPSQQLVSILRDGPEVGIHTITWCDTMTNLNRSLDRGVLREFALRIAFQMSGEDSSNFIDSTVANKLGANRAWFYNDDNGKLEKFRPFGLPID